MRCDAMRCDSGWAAGQTGKPVHMLTELKPTLWGTSSLSHPLTGSLAELVTTSAGAPIGHSGPHRSDAPEAVLHGQRLVVQPLRTARFQPWLLLLQVQHRKDLGLSGDTRQFVNASYRTSYVY